MFNTWFYLMLAVALADWYAVSCDRYRLRYATKPLVLALLMGWFTSMGGWQAAGGLFFGLALVFSLLGDVFLLKGLLMARPGFFQVGLGAFLAAQMLYVTGFHTSAALVSWQAGAAVLAVAAVGYFNGGRLIGSLRCTPEGAKLTPPVAVYMLALSLMLVSAAATLFSAAWPDPAALLAVLGAGLFYVSDSVLAHNEFVAPIRTGETLLTVTYHLGQIALVGGVLVKALG